MKLKSIGLTFGTIAVIAAVPLGASIMSVKKQGGFGCSVELNKPVTIPAEDIH